MRKKDFRIFQMTYKKSVNLNMKTKCQKRQKEEKSLNQLELNKTN